MSSAVLIGRMKSRQNI